MRRVLALGAVTACLSALLTMASAVPATAYPSANVVVSGHGFGHGRGMGQYGALGYALRGMAYTDILQHYYSNTTPGGIDPNAGMSVQLVAADAKDAIIYQPSAAPSVNGAAAPTKAMLVRESPPASNHFDVYYGPGCAGPWPPSPSASMTGPVNVTANGAGPDPSTMLHLCLPSGETAYEGSLSVLDGDGQQRTVNSLPMDIYLRGVVPRESPASWGSLGGGQGEEALKAQAVAARSYAQSQVRHSWAKTCDTTSCQVYGGRWSAAAGDLYGTSTYANSDNAVAATQGQVRILSGAVASTEFSSSTGGFTAGGSFPAVVDDGDSVPEAGNPNHDWTANIPVSSVEQAYAVGTLQSVTVVARTPADGGRRAQTVRVTGTGGSVDVAATAFQSQFGLKSTWFDIVNSPSGGVQGYWLVAGDGGIFTFGNASFYGSTGNQRLNSPVLGMASAPHGSGYWLVAGDGGIFTFGHTSFYGSTGNMRLNKPVVGMAATPDGGGYWLVATDGGIFSFGDASFFGSTGNMRLNQPIVGMAPTPSGKGYWLVARDGGIFSFGDAGFYGSTGAMRLNAPIVGMAAANGGQGYWLMASDGGIFTFGNAAFKGSLPGSGVREEATWITPTSTGGGYMIATAPGHVFSYGDAPNFGDMRQAVPNYRGRILGIEASRNGG